MYELATHPGRIKDRLLAAAPSLVGVNANVLSGEAAQEWNEAWEALAGSSAAEGAIGIALKAMDESDAVAIAKKVANVESRVTRLLEDE